MAAASLAFAGGYADAASYLLAQSFSGHITGNMVLIALSLAQLRSSKLALLGSAIALFLLSTYAGQWLKLSGRKVPATRSLLTALGMELILVALAPLGFIFHWPHGAAWLMVCLASAMGLQNGSYSQADSVSLHTTYITGTATTLIDTLAKKRAHAEPESQSSRVIGVIARVWSWFLLGAVLAGWLVPHWGALAVWGLEVPLLVTAIIQPSLARAEEKQHLL